MLEIINNKIWDFFRRTDVSLAMIFDLDGNIPWSKGRKITGSTVQDGGIFSLHRL